VRPRGPPNALSLLRTGPTTICSPIRTLRRSTTRCQTIYMSTGRSRRSRRASTYCARSRSVSTPTMLAVSSTVGGGALLDIGCYPIGQPPFPVWPRTQRALGLIVRDPSFGTDRIPSAVLDFGNGCSAPSPCRPCGCWIWSRGCSCGVSVLVDESVAAGRPDYVELAQRNGRDGRLGVRSGIVD
jgi:hypothetical protein